MVFEDLHGAVQKLYKEVEKQHGGKATVIIPENEYSLVELAKIFIDLYDNFKNPNVEIKNRVLYLTGEFYE